MSIKLSNGKIKTSNCEKKSVVMTIYKAMEWDFNGSFEKSTCVIKTWADQDLHIFVKLFCVQEEKGNLK